MRNSYNRTDHIVR